MKRRLRHWDTPKKESKVITQNKRTICVTVEAEEDRKIHFIEYQTKNKHKLY